jgi:hypothetical protein
MTTSRWVTLLLSLSSFLFAGCGSGGSSPKDCAGIAGGTSKVDACGVCALPADACVLPDTVASWNGTEHISTFGVTDTATYGQLVKVWDGASPMTGFSFLIGQCGADVTFRGSVYAWDGAKATGSSLFTSARFTLNARSAYQRVYFDTGSLSLPAGDYVVFVSTSDDQSGAPASGCWFGAMTNDTTYPDGHFVYLNNGANSAQWTSASWGSISRDLAFQVTGLSGSAADCAGTAGGRAVYDNCGTCDTDSANDCVLPTTLASWNGSASVGSFGVGATATYGQTIKVWDGAAPMTGFAVEIGNCSAAVTVRGSVYAWDGAKATGSSLFTSAAQTRAAGAGYALVSFDTGSLSLPAGEYVVFASTSADQAGAPNSSCLWGILGNDTTYPDGTFVYLNNGADTSAWTTSNWAVNYGRDLAFKVTGLVP